MCDFIPIPLICGTYPRSSTELVGGTCPVCGTAKATDVVTSYQRFCLFFIPLWKCGGTSTYGRCSRCGSTMPVAAVRRSLAAAYPIVPTAQAYRVGDNLIAGALEDSAADGYGAGPATGHYYGPGQALGTAAASHGAAGAPGAAADEGEAQPLRHRGQATPLLQAPQQRAPQVAALPVETGREL